MKQVVNYYRSLPGIKADVRNIIKSGLPSQRRFKNLTSLHLLELEFQSVQTRKFPYSVVYCPDECKFSLAGSGAERFTPIEKVAAFFSAQ